MLGTDHSDPLAPFEPLLDALAQRIVDKWLDATDARMVPQSISPLGPRAHRNAVKRRIANNEGGASIRGRRHLLTREALAEELRLRPPPKADPETVSGSPAPKPKSGGDRVSAFQAQLLKKIRAAGGGDE